MEKGIRGGSVTKRKRKRETARKVFDVIHDIAKKQLEFCQELEHTMKGIYYRLSTIQRFLEDCTYGCDLAAIRASCDASHPRLPTSQSVSFKNLTRVEKEAKELRSSWPTSLAVYNVNVPKTIPNVKGEFLNFRSIRLYPGAEERSMDLGSQIPFQFIETSIQNNPPALYHDEGHQDTGGVSQKTSCGRCTARTGKICPPKSPPNSAGGGSRARSAAASTAPSNAPSGHSRQQGCICAGPLRPTCDCKPGARRPGDGHKGPQGSAVTVAQKPAVGRGEPQEFSDKDLEDAFVEEHISDVELGSQERLFMKDFPDLDKNFEPQREYPMPFTPGQNYPGGYEPPEFSEKEMDEAFQEEEIPDADLKPNERLFMKEFPDLAGDWTPTSDAASHTSSCNRSKAPSEQSGQQPGKHTGQRPGQQTCTCAAGLQEECPGRARGFGDAPKTQHKGPQGSEVTVAQKPAVGRGEPQEFSDKDLEDAFLEEHISDVELGSQERLFMKDFPDLDKNFEPQREYPMPFTPGQNYPGGYEPPEFSEKEMDEAFQEEEILDADLNPNERLFMKEFPDLAGDWVPGSATASVKGSQHSRQAVEDGSPIIPPPEGFAERCCICGRIKLANKGLEGADRKGPAPHKSEPGGSAVTVAQKPALGAGEPQEFSDKDLEDAFLEEHISDVKIGPQERLFMKDFPDLDKNFEPEREYPMPFTPGQNYPGGYEPPEFSEKEMDEAFHEEEIPDGDLKPNERLFMKEFPDLAGDWVPGSATASVKSIPTSPRGVPPGYELCQKCGKLKRKIE